MVTVPLGGTRAARSNDKGVKARAWFAPPSRTVQEQASAVLPDFWPSTWTAANAESADGKVDPAGEALCENMRELTAHLRGIFHAMNSEEQMQMEKENLNQQCHPSVALCDIMRALTAKSLSKTASRARSQPVADEVISSKVRDGAFQGEAPRSTRRKETHQDKHRTSTPARRDPHAQRKRAASGESGSERLKRLGLVGIPPGKAEAALGLSGRRRKPSEVSDKAVERIQEAKSLSKTASRARSQPVADEVISSKVRDGAFQGEAPRSTRRKETHQDKHRTSTPARRDPHAQRKRAASGESGSERLKRLGLVGIPPGKAEAALGLSGRRRKPSEVSDKVVERIQEAARTRMVASLCDGDAQYSRSRRAQQHQGRLANRLRAATLARARLAREAMQTMLDSSGEQLSNLQDDGLVPRTAQDADAWLGRQAFAQWSPQHEDASHAETVVDQDRDEELDSVLSQDEENSPSYQEDGASYLTDADRQWIGEVLAERRRLREIPAPPRRLSWPLPSVDGRPRLDVPWGDVRLIDEISAESDRGRPPSRGGESWQPLGQTTPPAYEQVMPELFELWRRTQEPSQQPIIDPDSDGPEASEVADSASAVSQTSHPEVSRSSSPHPDIGPGHQIPDIIEGHELELLPDAGRLSDASVHDEDVEAEETDHPGQRGLGEDDCDQDDAGLEEVVEEDASDSSDSSECQIEEIEVQGMEGFQVDEWVCTATKAAISPEQDQVDEPESVTANATEQDASLKDGPGPDVESNTTGPAADAAAAQEKVTDEVVSVIMDELINDTIQSSAATEPALRHPTPIAPAFIDIFSEDSAPDGSSAESESVVQPSPRRPQKGEDTTSAATSGGVAKATSAKEEIRLAGLRTHQKQAPSKDTGPPRPPSPPPDLRGTGTESASFVAASHTSQSSPKGEQDTAELISQELLDMLLGEAFDEFDGTSLGRESPREDTRISIDAGSAPASPLAGPHPIDTSEAVVAPFIDVVFRQLGVIDEAQPIVGPLPDVEEWLPAVLEVMKTRHRATRGSEDRSKASTPSRPREEEETSLEEAEVKDVESFTRLLADSFMELAHEEVKEQGPRIMGWRRPCFGEAPLSRFRAKQEGTNPSQRQTWEKVRAKLTEAVRFGWRSEAAWDEPPAGRTVEDGGGAAVTLSNIDEGIDALLEEEICSDEASWLDIKGDVQKVKNQVAGMIFMDLVDEMVMEIGSMWSA